jgi:hypothetical protein
VSLPKQITVLAPLPTIAEKRDKLPGIDTKGIDEPLAWLTAQIPDLQMNSINLEVTPIQSTVEIVVVDLAFAFGSAGGNSFGHDNRPLQVDPNRALKTLRVAAVNHQRRPASVNMQTKSPSGPGMGSAGIADLDVFSAAVPIAFRRILGLPRSISRADTAYSGISMKSRSL